MALMMEEMRRAAARVLTAFEAEKEAAELAATDPEAEERYHQCRRETERQMAEYNRLVEEYQDGKSRSILITG